MLPGEETRRADWLLVMGRDALIGCCMVDARSGGASVGRRRVLLLSWRLGEACLLNGVACRHKSFESSRSLSLLPFNNDLATLAILVQASLQALRCLFLGKILEDADE